MLRQGDDRLLIGALNNVRSALVEAQKRHLKASTQLWGMGIMYMDAPIPIRALISARRQLEDAQAKEVDELDARLRKLQDILEALPTKHEHDGEVVIRHGWLPDMRPAPVEESLVRSCLEEFYAAREARLLEEKDLREGVYKSFGKRLRAWRKKLGIYQQDLEQACHLKPTTLHSYETGRFSPSLKVFDSLLKALNLTVDQFYGWEVDIDVNEEEV